MPLRLTDVAHQHVSSVLRPGDIAIDATAGNGHDTVFLAAKVGPSGMVLAIDLQELAIRRTRDQIEKAGYDHVTMIHGDHCEELARLADFYAGQVGAVMFNLGYLPSGDRRVITRPSTTMPALEHALQLLRPAGILSVLVYRGHPGGMEESQAIEEWTSSHQVRLARIAVYEGPAGKYPSPRLYLIQHEASCAT